MWNDATISTGHDLIGLNINPVPLARPVRVRVQNVNANLVGASAQPSRVYRLSLPCKTVETLQPVHADSTVRLYYVANLEEKPTFPTRWEYDSAF